MSGLFEAPLRIEPAPSRWATAWIIGVHGLGIATVPWLESAWLQLLCPVIVLVSAVAAVRARRDRARDPLALLLWRSDGRWECGRGSPAECAVMDAAPFVQPWLVVVRLRMEATRSRRYLVLFPDSVDAQVFRRLRVRLRCCSP